MTAIRQGEAMNAQRIQLRRTKGWRKPADAVNVARPTKWGNPFRWDTYPTTFHVGYPDESHMERVSDASRKRMAVRDFDNSLLLRRVGAPHHGLDGYPSDEQIKAELRGRDLACWCGPSDECHADVLLELANR